MFPDLMDLSRLLLLSGVLKIYCCFWGWNKGEDIFLALREENEKKYKMPMSTQVKAVFLAWKKS